MSERLAFLKDRAGMLARARAFFASRHILEVDCPLLSASASVDAHIDLIKATACGQTHYLHSSPEYGMKRLLSEGIGDIYQLSHVFRDGEQGVKHNPEFMMAEWYRVNFSFKEMIEETLDFVRLFLGNLPGTLISYRDAFKKFAEIDPYEVSGKDLKRRLSNHGIDAVHATNEDRDSLLNLLLGIIVEPHLGKDELCVLAYYPASQAALAKTCVQEGHKVAERFEIYYQGVELANGYHELADPIEQRQRLLEANQLRKMLGKENLPIDENFLAALEKGLPDCCGVAVGFDRLMMLRHKQKELKSILPFSFPTA
jgi:lysyl-tRNA synthetase class 2